MAGAASRTTNPILLLVIGAVVVYVVTARRTSAPWSRSMGVFLRLGLVVIVLRVVLVIVFGDRALPGHTIFTLPHVPLPAWAEGVSIGGPVTIESILQAAVTGLQLAVVLVCFGAANSLASPYRLLRCLPAVLYEAGVAITVSLSFAPELVMAIGDVREARRLRGRSVRGVSGIRGMAVPVLERALERSLQLASSMDARGYGRRVAVARGVRRWATGGTAAGLLLILAGVYGILVAGSLPGGGIPFVALGAVLVGVGLAAGGRRTNRTRYRPDPWRAQEWLVSASGVVVVTTLVAAGLAGVPGLQFVADPLTAPTLPIVAVVGILVGLAPAWIAPVEQAGAVSASTTSDRGGVDAAGRARRAPVGPTASRPAGDPVTGAVVSPHRRAPVTRPGEPVS
jgi:energy-coupling factor transport system permease protein